KQRESHLRGTRQAAAACGGGSIADLFSVAANGAVVEEQFTVQIAHRRHAESHHVLSGHLPDAVTMLTGLGEGVVKGRVSLITQRRHRFTADDELLALGREVERLDL